MRITFEKHKRLVMIYIYFREFNGKIVRTIPDVTCELLFSKENDWIGMTIINQIGGRREIALPQLKDFAALKGLKFNQSEKQITLLFDTNSNVNNRVRNICNVDYNDDGLFGLEIMLNDFSGKTKAIEPFATFRGDKL